MRRLLFFASVITAVLCFAVYVRYTDGIDADTVGGNYTLVNSDNGYALYLGDVKLIESEMTGICEYISDNISEDYFLILGKEESLSLNDDTLILGGNCTLLGTAVGSPLLTASVIRFDGQSLICNADIINESDSRSTSALVIAKADSVEIRSDMISGGKGMALSVLSSDVSVDINGYITSENTAPGLGTFVVSGDRMNIVIDGRVTNTSLADDARVLNMTAAFSGDVEYIGGLLGFYDGDAGIAARGTIVTNASDGTFKMTAGSLRLTESVAVAVANIGGGTISISGGTINSGKGLAIANIGNGRVIIDESETSETLITSSHLNEGTINSSGIGRTSVTVEGGSVINTAVVDTFSDPNIIFHSYAIYTNNAEKCDIFINGGQVQIGSSELDCAAVYAGSSGKFSMSGGVIVCENGDAVINAGSGSVEISGGTVYAGENIVCNMSDGTVAVFGGDLTGTEYIAQNVLECGNIVYGMSPILSGKISTYGHVTVKDFKPINKVTVEIANGKNGLHVFDGSADAGMLVSSSPDGGFVNVDGVVYFVYKINVMAEDESEILATVYATPDGNYPTAENIPVDNGYKFVGYYVNGKLCKPGDALMVDGMHAVRIAVEKIHSPESKSSVALTVSLSVTGGIIVLVAATVLIIWRKRRASR